MMLHIARIQSFFLLNIFCPFQSSCSCLKMAKVTLRVRHDGGQGVVKGLDPGSLQIPNTILVPLCLLLSKYHEFVFRWLSGKASFTFHGGAWGCTSWYRRNQNAFRYSLFYFFQLIWFDGYDIQSRISTKTVGHQWSWPKHRKPWCEERRHNNLPEPQAQFHQHQHHRQSNL